MCAAAGHKKSKIASKETNAIPPKAPATIAPIDALFSAGVGTMEGLGDDVVPEFGTIDAVRCEVAQIVYYTKLSPASKYC